MEIVEMSLSIATPHQDLHAIELLGRFDIFSSLLGRFSACDKIPYLATFDLTPQAIFLAPALNRFSQNGS